MIREVRLSIAYQCVLARLQYGLQYIRGRQFVLGTILPASLTG